MYYFLSYDQNFSRFSGRSEMANGRKKIKINGLAGEIVCGACAYDG